MKIEPGTLCQYHSGKPTYSKKDGELTIITWPINCDHPAKHRIWHEMMHGSDVYCDCHLIIKNIEWAKDYLSKVEEVKTKLLKSEKELKSIICP